MALLFSLVILAVLAVIFGIITNAHYDGPLAAPLPPGAPRNFLSFRSPFVYQTAAFFAFPIVVHWLAIGWKRQAFAGYRLANTAYFLAFAALILLWTDSILDDYYHISMFCPLGGERLNAIDVDWRCASAFYAREVVIPIAIPLLIVISLVLRLLPAPRSPRSDQP